MNNNNDLIVTLNFERSCTTKDIGGGKDITTESGSVDVSLGCKLPIAKFRDIKVEEISNDYIRLCGDEEQILHKGGFVTFSWSDDGDDDHEGVSWKTDYHFLKLTWKE